MALSSEVALSCEPARLSGVTFAASMSVADDGDAVLMDSSASAIPPYPTFSASLGSGSSSWSLSIMT